MCFTDFPFRLLLLLSVGRLLKRFLYPLRTHIFVCVCVPVRVRVCVCVFYFPIQVAAGDVKMADTVERSRRGNEADQGEAPLSSFCRSLTLNAKVN